MSRSHGSVKARKSAGQVMNGALPGKPKGAKPMAANAAVITIRATLIGVLLVFSSSLQAQQVPCSYSVHVLPNVDCGSFGGPGTPTALNNLGHVVGIFVGCGKPLTESFMLCTLSVTTQNSRLTWMTMAS